MDGGFGYLLGIYFVGLWHVPFKGFRVIGENNVNNLH